MNHVSASSQVSRLNNDRPRRLIVVCSPKGGVGKTTLARCLLVAASKEGIGCLGIDFDPQASLSKWGTRRERTQQRLPGNYPDAEVRQYALGDWRSAVRAASAAGLAVADTPPSVEHDLDAILGLCREADFVAVPVGATQDDLDSVMPWMATLLAAGIPASFVMNRVNRRTRTFGLARDRLIKSGPVCPIEVPLLEDIHSFADKGLTILDVEKAKGQDTMDSVWSHIRREARL